MFDGFYCFWTSNALFSTSLPLASKQQFIFNVMDGIPSQEDWHKMMYLVVYANNGKIVCNFYIHVIKCEVWCLGVGGQKQIWNGVLWNPKSRRFEMKWDPLYHMLCGLYNSSIWCCLFFYAYCMTSKSCEFGILQF